MSAPVCPPDTIFRIMMKMGLWFCRISMWPREGPKPWRRSRRFRPYTRLPLALRKGFMSRCHAGFVQRKANVSVTPIRNNCLAVRKRCNEQADVDKVGRTSFCRKGPGCIRPGIWHRQVRESERRLPSRLGYRQRDRPSVNTAEPAIKAPDRDKRTGLLWVRRNPDIDKGTDKGTGLL